MSSRGEYMIFKCEVVTQLNLDRNSHAVNEALGHCLLVLLDYLGHVVECVELPAQYVQLPGQSTLMPLAALSKASASD